MRMFSFLSYFYHILLILNCINIVKTEEPCAPLRYTELRLFEKMVEVENKLQTVLERLDNLGENERHKTDKIQSETKVQPGSLTVAALEIGGWEMIFRATSGNGQDVFKAWTTGHGTCGDKPYTMERSYSCHYRNSLVSNWVNLGIQQVKFAFYDSFREVAYITFNGKESDMTNWFDKSRVIASSWSDLTSTHNYNYFSIQGHVDLPSLDRRFFVNRLYHGCPGDLGHVVVINSAVASPVCFMDGHASYPQFLYSKVNSVDIWQKRMFGTADFMAIFVKF